MRPLLTGIPKRDELHAKCQTWAKGYSEGKERVLQRLEGSAMAMDEVRGRFDGDGVELCSESGKGDSESDNWIGDLGRL